MQSSKTLASTFRSGSLSQVHYSVFWSVFSQQRFFVDEATAMSVAPVIFVLVILLFGFDSSVSSALSAVRRFFEIF